MLILKNQLNDDGGLEKQTFSICKAFSQKYPGRQAQNKAKDGNPEPEVQKKIVILTTKAKTNKKQKSNASSAFKLKNHFLKNLHLHLIKKLPVPHFLQLVYYNHQVKKYLKKHPHKLVLGLDKSTCQTHLRMGNGLHSFFLKQRRAYENFWKKLFLFFDPRHWTILWFEKKALLNPNLRKIITNSHMVKDQILTLYPAHEKKIKVVHNGIKWKKLKKNFQASFQKRSAFLKEKNLNASENTHHFLFVGHGFKRKGLDILLQALSLLKQDQISHKTEITKTAWHLSIVGKDKQAKFYQKLAKKLGLEKNVTFFGRQKDCLSFYSICDTFVLPSYYDPFANTTLEALAMGVFTITSAYNGGKEVINPKNGYVMQTMDPHELFLVLKNALSHPKTEASAEQIRLSVKHLEMDQQISLLIKELN